MPDIAMALTYSDEEASEACHYLALLRQEDLRTDLCHRRLNFLDSIFSLDSSPWHTRSGSA